MRLHRLVLTNYRGIDHREIVLPDSGVIVVSGGNEIGKSSMIEAIDLLLDAKDRSAKKNVKQVKPTHADLGAEVEAEISSGPYRFVYRKRFHKRFETQLTLLAPRREQLTGDEAHEKVRTILAETVDSELWRAQRVLQASSTDPVDLSRCDALSRALDVAAGDSLALSGAEPLLVDRVDTEYARYYTATGRPTGALSAADVRLHVANREVDRCATAVAEVDDAVCRHDKLASEAGELTALRDIARQRLTAALATSAVVAELRSELGQAEMVAAAAEAIATASAAALTERSRLRADVDVRVLAVTELETAASASAEEESGAREVEGVAAQAAEQSQVAARQAHERVDAAHRTLDLLRLAKIDAAEADLDRVEQQLAQTLVSESELRDIEVAAAAVEQAAARAESASACIDITAAADIELRVGDQQLTLVAGSTFTTTASSPTDIEVAGLLCARVDPGAVASDTRATLEAVTTHLSELLTAAGVGDVAAAQAAARRRRELISEREKLAATLAGLCDDEPAEALRARLSPLRHELDTDVAAARLELDAAQADHRQARAQCETDGRVAAAAAAKRTQKSTCATVLHEKLTAGRAELGVARERLAAHRANHTDDDVLVRAHTDKEAAERATGRVADLRARLDATAPDDVAIELHDAQRDTDELDRRSGAIADELRDIATQLRVYGTEGRKGRLDSAMIERGHAHRECSSLRRRARAARVLRVVLSRHRADSRRRYVAPFRAEVERLGRLVFGDTFEVEIDSDLRICSRTLAGRTVPYESLSGGAKEQLAIVARLAGAALVAPGDTVPVIIDDALGFTDADRLAKMGAVFDAVGGDGQVLVLTCNPRRFDSVDAPHHIELTA